MKNAFLLWLRNNSMQGFWTPQTQPLGWTHPRLGFHRAWHTRLTLRWRLRLALGFLCVLALAVAFGATPWWFGVGALVLLLPFAPSKMRTLQDLENTHGAAYTTALQASTQAEDKHGFQTRLERQADHIAQIAPLPHWPWVELGLALLVVSFGMLIAKEQPLVKTLGRTTPSTQTRPQERGPEDQPVDQPVVADAPSATNPKSNTGDQGRALGSGVPGEQTGVADAGTQKKPSDGDLDALSKEYLDALERQTKRDATSNTPNDVPAKPPSNDTRNQQNKPSASQQDKAPSNPEDNAGQEETGGGAQKNKNLNQNQPRQNQAKPNAAQNNNPPSDSQTPSDPKNPNTEKQKPGKPAQTQPRPNSSGPQPQNRNANKDAIDENSAGSNTSANRTPQNGKSQPGQADKPGRTSNEAPQNAVRPPNAANGQLEYLPGQVRNQNNRAGALQLPGRERDGFGAAPGSATYKRAVESAVLDPRLPPEYQEMLRNYYK